MTVLILSLLTGCDFIKNAFTYKDKTKGFIESVLKKDYNNAIGYFAMEHEIAKDSNSEEMKASFARFREIIVKDFGTDLDFTFMNAEKKFSTKEEENTAPNTTVALIEFSNGKEFGIFKVVFDDKSGKILNINTLDVKKPVPSMIYFWLFGLVALCVPIFNIYVIRQIKKSDLRKKKLKYIAVFVFNVPALTYAAVSGFSFNILSFQILLGLSFSYMGYLGSVWTFGIPLGGLYWFWKIRQRKIEVAETEVAAY
ncbi:hypothetical protein [Hymenobacter radiodurans]|uniref:hypothetical protein n=1 Tax=Hymenobacter radiodurans TaxID=2496028 RepID=UPI00196AC175|nr:hypothetical protein [Hymenobacter radiodurans]